MSKSEPKKLGRPIRAGRRKHEKPMLDGALVRELTAIADHISALSRMIGDTEDAHRTHIPAAGQELDAIIRATESASNTILACAEDVMAADARDAARYERFVQKRMLNVIEACLFQDLTGQRIAKLIDTLGQIESRLMHFTGGGPETNGASKGWKYAAPANDVPAHGPANGGEGMTQEAVDEIMNGRRRKSRRRR